ncbi:hypothetical protein K438DRAFT_1938581 [Mycena galopus ATCC 62051]|nr:hypothetical protein K438DRAFT_1938581 [Mycena galopus ATCC 62051]
MHRSLSIPEIRDSIFAQLEDDDGNHSIQDLRLRGLQGLPKSSLGFLVAPTAHSQELVQPSDIEETKPKRGFSNWSVLLKYAFLIQRIHLLRPEDLKKAQHIHRKIGPWLPPGREHLCPNLKCLKLRLCKASDSPVLMPCISLLCGPKIVDLSVILASGSESAALSLSLPIPWTQLTTLYLGNPSVGEQPVQRGILSEIALGLNDIQDLSCDHLDQTAMEHTSQLPRLQKLTLKVPAVLHLPSPQFWSSVETPLLPALRHLCFEDTTIEFAVAFLDLLAERCLIDLYIGTVAVVMNSTIGELYTAITHNITHSALQILEDVAPKYDSVIELPLLSWKDAPRLMSSMGARFPEIILQSSIGFDIDDGLAWAIAQAWPRVELLLLATAIIDKDVRYPGSHRLPIPSFIFERGKSPITDPPAVATFMSALFPNLVDIEWRTLMRIPKKPSTLNGRTY